MIYLAVQDGPEAPHCLADRHIAPFAVGELGRLNMGCDRNRCTLRALDTVRRSSA